MGSQMQLPIKKSLKEQDVRFRDWNIWHIIEFREYQASHLAIYEIQPLAIFWENIGHLDTLWQSRPNTSWWLPKPLWAYPYS